MTIHRIIQVLRNIGFLLLLLNISECVFLLSISFPLIILLNDQWLDCKAECDDALILRQELYTI